MAVLYQAILEQIATDPNIRVQAVMEELDNVDKQRRQTEERDFQAASLQKLKSLKRRAVTEMGS